MFDRLRDRLFNRPFRGYTHTRLVVNPDGSFGQVPATCAEVECGRYAHIGTSTGTDETGTNQVPVILSCATAERQRQRLLDANVAQAETIEEQKREIARLGAELANCRRLMALALPVIFKLGPELQGVLAENVSDPKMTDDGTAVKLEGLEFVLLVLPYDERVIVRAVGVNIADKPYSIRNGIVSEDDQTSMMGQIGRIKRAHESGADPVGGAIQLVAHPTAA